MNIKITNLSKKYLTSKIKCLNNINVSINEGVYGLLGENGAGKTSLLKTIATILPIQTGNIQVEKIIMIVFRKLEILLDIFHRNLNFSII